MLLNEAKCCNKATYVVYMFVSLDIILRDEETVLRVQMYH